MSLILNPITAPPSRRAKRRELWRKDPIAFFTQALDVKPAHVWFKMKEMTQAVRDYPRVAVRAGHAVSKSYCSARLALWFLYCHSPATVVTTAPTVRQVQEILWREIRQAHANSKIPLGGKLTTTKLDMQEDTGQKWYAIGFAARPDTVTYEATAMQGYHNQNIMVIFDEAAGVLPQIWKATQHLLTSGFTRWLVIGNLTSPQGNFPDCFAEKSEWHKISISVKDTPNFKEGREVVPGLAGREYEQLMREKYGENSNEYRIRILGEMPDYGEGTYFGKEMAAAEINNQIGFFPHENTAKVYTFWDIGHTHTVIWFAQFLRDHIRLIDFYYDSKGLGLPEYAARLQRRPYVYAQHFAPWDIQGGQGQGSGPNARNVQTGKYLIDTARELGVDFTVNAKYRPEDGIAAIRDIISLCQFHKSTTAEGIIGLQSYRRQINNTTSTPERPVYFDHPVRDYTIHIADAFRVLAMTYRYELLVNNVPLGYPAPVRAIDDQAYFEGDGYNPLTFSLTRGRRF